MTRLAGTALRVTIFIGENDTWHHKPLLSEIVHRAHKASLAGAGVFRGIEGFGATSLIHTTRLLPLSEDLRWRSSSWTSRTGFAPSCPSWTSWSPPAC